MKHRPLTRICSAIIALTVMAAWLCAANHCVVAGLLPKQPQVAAGHEHCGMAHKQAPPGKEQRKGCNSANCCKALSAPSVAMAKALVQDASALPIDFAAELCALSQHYAGIAEIDTGPPDRESFAESVLQRSILAHAPPPAA